MPWVSPLQPPKNTVFSIWGYSPQELLTTAGLAHAGRSSGRHHCMMRFMFISCIVTIWFKYHFISIFHFMLKNNHNNKQAWAQTNWILYQHYASNLQKFSHCKFKYEKPDLIKEHYKAREIQIDTYPWPFISSSADPCFLIRSGNAKAFSAE